MKIAVIIPSFYPVGGAETFVKNLCKAYKRCENIEVIVISLYNQQNNTVVKDLRNNNFDIKFLNKKRGVDFNTGCKLKKILFDFKPDVVHTHLDVLVTMFVGGCLNAFKGRIFHTFHTTINSESVGKKNSFKNILSKYLFTRKIVVPVAISNKIKKSIEEFYDLKNGMVECVYNGVPVGMLDFKIPFSERKYDFIYIGRFIPLKRTELIVNSFICFSKNHPKNCNMIMLGEGEDFEKCNKIAIEKNCENISFLGFVDNVNQYLSNSKFLILASTREGNPIVINEAIATGTYVIATAVGGVPDVIDKNTGLLLDPYIGEKELSKQMEYCFANQQTIENMIKLNIKENRRKVDINNVAYNYIQLFERNIGGKK